MLNANPETHSPETDEAAVERIERSGAQGALTLVAIATAVVLGTWFAFYFWVFLPRAVAP